LVAIVWAGRSPGEGDKGVATMSRFVQNRRDLSMFVSVYVILSLLMSLTGFGFTSRTSHALAEDAPAVETTAEAPTGDAAAPAADPVVTPEPADAPPPAEPSEVAAPDTAPADESAPDPVVAPSVEAGPMTVSSDLSADSADAVDPAADAAGTDPGGVQRVADAPILSYSAVPPVLTPGNPPLGSGGVRIDNPASGTYTFTYDGVTAHGTITVHDTPNGPEFDFSSEWPITRVVVKGGPDANTYTYSPSVTSDTGLHAPANSSDKWAGLSHVDFYWSCQAMKPGIKIDKKTNGLDQGGNVAFGSPVTWTYSVTNNGSVALSNVTVTDDKGVTPLYVSGDTDADGKLDLTETWLYQATGTAIVGSYTNTGTAKGKYCEITVCATDKSCYTGISKPGIKIDKKTNGLDHGGNVAFGSTVTWTYSVTNTGNVALSNVTVTDDKGVTPLYVSGDTLVVGDGHV
jgi:uncharacterized repeat protein (TIGR01451 family)